MNVPYGPPILYLVYYRVRNVDPWCFGSAAPEFVDALEHAGHMQMHMQTAGFPEGETRIWSAPSPAGVLLLFRDPPIHWTPLTLPPSDA